MARKRHDGTSGEPIMCWNALSDAIQCLESPAMVVGRNPHGRPQFKGLGGYLTFIEAHGNLGRRYCKAC